MSRILVTGNKGFIGSVLSRELEQRGHDVTGFDFADYRTMRDDECMDKHLSGVDGIMHLAGVSRVIWGEHFPGLCAEYNVDLTRRLLRAAQAQASRPWLIFASSKEVYGSKQHPCDESAQLDPLSTYARSKIEAEALCMAAGEAGLRTGILRLSTVYGREGDYADRLIPLFLRQALAGKELVVNGRDVTIDATHVTDVVSAFQLLADFLESERDACTHLFNIATGTGTSLVRLIQAIEEAIARPVQYRVAAHRGYTSQSYVGNSGKASRMLAWQPRHDLRFGIHEYLHLLSSHAQTSRFFRTAEYLPASNALAPAFVA